jgi:hypothetical protein
MQRTSDEKLPTGRFTNHGRAARQRLRTTHTCLWRFSGRLAGYLYKLPLAEIVANIRIW